MVRKFCYCTCLKQLQLGISYNGKEWPEICPFSERVLLFVCLLIRHEAGVAWFCLKKEYIIERKIDNEYIMLNGLELEVFNSI